MSIHTNNMNSKVSQSVCIFVRFHGYKIKINNMTEFSYRDRLALGKGRTTFCSFRRKRRGRSREQNLL